MRGAVLSLSHEFLVDLFRQRPALASELLRACADLRLPDATPDLGSIDLSQVTPPEYRTDSLVVLRDRRRKAVAAVIVEVQLKIDGDKLLAWPAYVAVARARFACPVTLLVLAPKRAVARWASRPIDLGHPGYTLQPIVIGFPQVPRITEAARARAAPELAVLSALAHPELAVVKAALGAFDVLTEDNQKLYWDVIHAGLPATVRRALEASMKGYEYQSEFARKYYSQGREQGREEGLRSAIIELVCARLPRFRDELAGRLSAQPEALLTRIVAELGKARTERELRAVLDRVLGAAPAARRRRRTTGPASPSRSAGRHEPRRSRRSATPSM